MESKLTYEMIEKLSAVMARSRPKGYTLIANPLLRGTQTIVLCGDKMYYCPDISAGEVRVIKIPEMKPEVPKVHFDYQTDNYSTRWPISSI